jgi:hypothetical protein
MSDGATSRSPRAVKGNSGLWAGGRFSLAFAGQPGGVAGGAASSRGLPFPVPA